MIASFISAILAAAKASQAFDSILKQLTDAYIVWKSEENTRLRAEKDARNRELVAGAGGVREPDAADTGDAAGQHGDTGKAP